MKKSFSFTPRFSLLFAFLIFFACPAWADDSEIAVAEDFVGRVILENLDSPWGLIWGPDGKLWITERSGKRVTEVDPASGRKRTLITINEVFADPQHQGLLGLALAPDFDRSGLAYVTYTYKDRGQSRQKIVRLKYDQVTKTLTRLDTVIDGIPAADDHQGGRLIFGPDGNLYLSKGDLGRNQGSNRCLANEAQRLPAAEEVEAKDWSGYLGKVLRLAPDGSIPADNPLLNGVRSHVYTLGQRNPQGLVFVDDTLYAVDQGPSTDDELNILTPGGNYGWPYVAGFQDDQSYAYIKWADIPGCEKIDANVYLPPEYPRSLESDFNAPNLTEPVKTFYTVPNGYNFADPKFGQLSFLGFATIAPSSVDYYPADGPIKAWRNSILISSLKNGAIYRVPLSQDKTQAQGDLIKYFHTPNRYRQVLVAADGKSIYVITDSGGIGLDENGLPATAMKNPGALIQFKYND